MSGYLDRPPIRQLVVAVRHARESIDGTPKAVAIQAEALLVADHYTVTPEDRRTLLRLAERP